MLRLYAFLVVGLRLLQATIDCPGWCGHPLEKLIIWTDNPHIWRCELPSITVTRCSNVATAECLRLDDLGGDLYLMLFPDSPNTIGIDPDYLAKGRVDVLRTQIHCKNGSWTLPESNIRMTHLLCDQYIIDHYKALTSENKPLPPVVSKKASPDDDLLISDVKVTEALKKEASGFPNGGYPLPVSPEPPTPTSSKAAEEDLSKPPDGTYALPNPPTNAIGQNLAKEKENPIIPPVGAYVFPNPGIPLEVATYPSATSTPYLVPTVTATISLTTSSSRPTTESPSTTTPLLTTTTTSTTPPASRTAMSTTRTTPTGTLAASSPKTTTTAPSSTTPKPPATHTTSSASRTSTAITRAEPACNSLATATQTTTTKAASTTPAEYPTGKSPKEERAESTTPSPISHSSSGGYPIPTTRQTITTTASTTTEALKTSSSPSTPRPFVKLSITHKEETNQPVVDPYGDDPAPEEKQEPQRTWSREQSVASQKTSEPRQVKIVNRKAPTAKRTHPEALSRAIRARPLREEQERKKFRGKSTQRRGRLVGLQATNRKSTQQRKKKQLTRSRTDATIKVTKRE